MNWLRRFMAGRYGGDQLSMVLVLLSVIFSVAGWLFNLQILTFLSYIPLLISVFRVLSKNVNARSMENYRFMMFMSPLYAWFRKTQQSFTDLKNYKYFRCPKCGAKLRVPRGKGKVMVTCRSCKTEFKKKT